MLKWEIRELELPGVKLLIPRRFADERGWLCETYSREFFAEHVSPANFARDVASFSRAGVLRGLHFEVPANEKLVRVAVGSVSDVVVNTRRDSATFGKWLMVELSAERGDMLYIPGGFAHGYFSREGSLVLYKLSGEYSPTGARTILWNDPDLAISWPCTNPVLSPADAKGMRFADC